MADTAISGLSAVATPAGTDEFAVNQGGASKKMSLSQISAYGISLPTFVAATAEFTSTGVPTATLPTGHTADDILVLVLQSSNDNLVTAPAGYTQLGPQNGIGAGAAAGANRLSIFWKRDGGSEVAPTIPDTGDHTYGMMFAVRGCPTSGDPFTIGGNNFKTLTSTTGTSPASITPVDNCLVVDVFAGSADNASAEGSALTNASLASLTEQFDDGTTDGTGGFIYVASGTKVNAGAVSATTVTWANTSVDLCTRIHFLPLDKATKAYFNRQPEVLTYIGSPTDTDDTWVKPTGARKILAQLCDGGGSGSGGNTTTTAAGGGGGGGGGYDEAWYDADRLGATVTVHAGKGGASTALLGAGNAGVLSQFDKGNRGPLTSSSRVAGTAATAGASADGGNGGSGSGRGHTSPAVATTRISLEAATAGAALGGVGGRGGSGTTGTTGGSPADWGGGGGESGADTDTGISSASNGWSARGASGGSGGRTNTNISQSGDAGGAAGSTASQGLPGANSTMLPYGASGGTGGGSSVAQGGDGGFPGGGGGGGGGVSSGGGGAGGHGCVVVTTFF